MPVSPTFGLRLHRPDIDTSQISEARDDKAARRLWRDIRDELHLQPEALKQVRVSVEDVPKQERQYLGDDGRVYLEGSREYEEGSNFYKVNVRHLGERNLLKAALEFEGPDGGTMTETVSQAPLRHYGHIMLDETRYSKLARQKGDSEQDFVAKVARGVDEAIQLHHLA